MSAPAGLWLPPKAQIVRPNEGDGALLELYRQRVDGKRELVQTPSGTPKRGHQIHLGPNMVHAFITHKDGSITDLGISHNLLTNRGRDWWADNFGAKAPAGGQGTPATATGATSITATGTPWTASALGSNELGLAGKLIFCPITNITTQPVFGTVVSNTTSVATVDAWWTPDFAGTGTTPSSTVFFEIMPGRGPGAFFMALTSDSGAAAAGDNTLTSEITTNGGARSKVTYAHSNNTATATHVVVFTITGTLTAVHKMGLFPTKGAADAAPMLFEAVLNQDATLGNGDTLTVTDTITYTG